MGKKARKSQKAQKATEEQAPSMMRRKLIMLPLVAVGLGTAAVGINAYETKNRNLHDLTVIGQGEPTLVQIHDPGCPVCRRLNNVVTKALDSDDSVLYRLADITSTEGAELQKKYNVPHITLLYFDRAGKHVHTTQGMQTPDEVRETVAQFLK